MISSSTLLQLRNKAAVGLRKMIGDFTGEERGLRAGCSGIVGGEAVQKDASARAVPNLRTKLRSHTGQDSGQDVSAAALAMPGFPVVLTKARPSGVARMV